MPISDAISVSHIRCHIRIHAHSLRISFGFSFFAPPHVENAYPQKHQTHSRIHSRVLVFLFFLLFSLSADSLRYAASQEVRRDEPRFSVIRGGGKVGGVPVPCPVPDTRTRAVYIRRRPWFSVTFSFLRLFFTASARRHLSIFFHVQLLCCLNGHLF